MFEMRVRVGQDDDRMEFHSCDSFTMTGMRRRIPRNLTCFLLGRCRELEPGSEDDSVSGGTQTVERQLW